MEWAAGLLIGLAVLLWLIASRRPVDSPASEQPLVEALLNNSPAVVAVVTYPAGESRLEVASPALLRLLDCEQDQTIGRSWRQVLGPVAGAHAQAEDQAVLAAGESQAFVSRMGVRGRRRTLMATKFPVQWRGIPAVGMVALDVTDHRRHDRLMRLSFDLSPVPMARLALDDAGPGDVLDANEALGQLLGVPAESLRGTQLDAYTDQPWSLPIIADQTSAAREVRFTTADGRHLWVALTISAVGGDLDEQAFALAVLQDVTSRRHAEHELTHQAHHDALTGLPNRNACQQQLAQSLLELQAGQECVAVLFCDLDGFKSLNDTLSHRAGDEVLVEVADRLRTAIGPHDSVARLGGDEFVVVARRLTDSAEAVTIGQSLCDAIAAPFRVDGRTVRLGLSVGVSTTSDPSSSTEDLLRQADLAMYSAKDNGRNRVEVYVPELQAAAIERMAVEEQLREAIAQATVAVDYQPIISLSGSGVTAVEALVRVPTTLPISAADFVEVAQRTGLMSTLGEQILRRVGQDVRDWAALGFRIRVHVNVSRAQLQDPDFMAMCEAALGTGISSDQVCFEVSDPTVLSDSEAVVQTLWELRGRGFHVGIDGFGAGHAGLATLRRIPADYLKIDRCFLVNLATAREDQVIVAAIVQLAHQLGRTVIATGVETAEQREMLRTLGCDEIQGYLHSPAVAADLVPGLVQRMTRTVPARRG